MVPLCGPSGLLEKDDEIAAFSVRQAGDGGLVDADGNPTVPVANKDARPRTCLPYNPDESGQEVVCRSTKSGP